MIEWTPDRIMKVLIVDDDDATRQVVDLAVRKLGHDTVQASNGQEGWEMHRKEAFPLIICDWMMPKLSGPDFCRAVRSVAQNTYTFFFILTSLDTKQNFVEAFQAGADDFMTKPVDIHELKARVGVAERILGLHTRVTMLEGLLSICAYCKKIRDDQANWQHVERFIAAHTAVNFSHAICPACKARVGAERGG